MPVATGVGDRHSTPIRPRDRTGPARPADEGRTRISAGDGGELRDLAIASESHPSDGHEVTTAPSDADQSETERIVTEAVEAGPTPQEIEAHEAGAGPNQPPMPIADPSSTGSSGVSHHDNSDPRDTEMNRS